MTTQDGQVPDGDRASARELVAEALGGAFLVATVVGSGIMAEQLSGGIPGLRCLLTRSPPAPYWWC